MSQAQVRTINQLPELHERPVDGNKGTFGKVLLIAGSGGMSGAAVLSGLGALRGGAGLVYLAVPPTIQDIVASAEPSYLTVRLSENEKGLIDVNPVHRENILEPYLISSAAVGIGPGIGQSDSLKEFVRWIYETTPVPVVFDADAINLLSQLDQLPKNVNGPRILTPHPGEFSRLIRKPIEEIQADRQQLAVNYAKENQVILLLKGAGSVITDGHQLAVNPTGNPGMATGGTGDVLTGLITALLGQGYAPFEAAQLGAYLHGLAGDIAAKELSQQGMIASDLPHYLTKAWREMQ